LISRVFVVDDERVIASTLTAILTVNGYDARCFVNPLEALEAARTAGPDLLISDVDAETATALVANAGTDVVAAPTEHQQEITRIRIKGMWGSLATRDNATVGTAPVWNGNLVSIVRWQFAGIEVLPDPSPQPPCAGKPLVDATRLIVHRGQTPFQVIESGCAHAVLPT
jgi:CheY-like chemotaxis protein